MEYKTYQTEDGHTKADCPICEASEHIQILEEKGKCEICQIEGRELIELTLIKKQTFKLEPYGRFSISMARHPKRHLPHVVPLDELSIDHQTSMPFTEAQEKEVIKLMKKHKTDILTDGGYLGFYTRAGQGKFASLCHVAHPKLVAYKENEAFRQDVDDR